MTAPIPEEQDQPSSFDETPPGEHPPGEHGGDLPRAGDAGARREDQEENAETSLDEPSDDAGGQ